MLPQQARLHHRGEFSEAVRLGARAGTPTLVVHLVVDRSDRSPRAGLIVSRAIGSAVSRNRVRRRLRALLRERLDRLPAGSWVVVRALPAAAVSPSARLGADLDQALARLAPARPKPAMSTGTR